MAPPPPLSEAENTDHERRRVRRQRRRQRDAVDSPRPHAEHQQQRRPLPSRLLKTHRAYGLPNANQILLTLVASVMLFFELLRPRWLVFDPADATAGLFGLELAGPNATRSRLPWREYCDPDAYNLTAPLDATRWPPLEQPLSPTEAQWFCDRNIPELTRVLTATSIAFAVLSLSTALYLHLGVPSQRQIALLGILPGLALLVTAILGFTVLILWGSHFSQYDHGDCFGLAVASTVIATLASVSMVIRWRWPGICAVPNEQQAFEARSHRRPLAGGAATTTTTTTNTTTTTAAQDPSPAQSPRAANTFHRIV